LKDRVNTPRLKNTVHQRHRASPANRAAAVARGVLDAPGPFV
jgi:hypothetical protein